MLYLWPCLLNKARPKYGTDISLAEIVSITDVQCHKQFGHPKFCVFEHQQNPFQLSVNWWGDWWGDWWGIRVDRANFCPNRLHTIGRIVNGCNKLFVRESVQPIRQCTRK